MPRIYKRKYCIEDYQGKKIFHWYVTGKTKIVLSPSKVKYRKNSRHYYWEVVCDCGFKTWVRNASLVNGGSTGCGACAHSTNDNSYQVKSWYVSQIKNKAKERGFVFEVEIAYLQELWEKQRGKCALSGLPIVLSTKFGTPQTASLDRIDSSRGYIKGNLQWVHNDINKMKLHHSQEKFLDLCKRIANFSPTKST